MSGDGIMASVTVSESDGGARLDSLLARLLEPAVTRSRVQKLVADGKVSVIAPGKRPETAAKNRPVRPGERIVVAGPLSAAATPPAGAEDIPLDIVYEDDCMLVVNKPKGMVVHPAPGHCRGTLVSALLFHTGSRLSGLGGGARPGIVHRLDKDTSGLLAVAKTDAAHARLAGQLLDRSMGRVYMAIVHGAMKSDAMTISEPIGRHPRDRKKMAVDRLRGKPAVTHARAIRRLGRFTYIEARLQTGRTHQIRVHMAHAGHPVLGCRTYGPKKPPAGYEDGQMLHAARLSLAHPATGERMEFGAPPPPCFVRALAELGGG